MGKRSVKPMRIRCAVVVCTHEYIVEQHYCPNTPTQLVGGGQHSQPNESPLSSASTNPIRVNVMRRYCSYVIALWRCSYIIQSLEHNSLWRSTFCDFHTFTWKKSTNESKKIQTTLYDNPEISLPRPIEQPFPVTLMWFAGKSSVSPISITSTYQIITCMMRRCCPLPQSSWHATATSKYQKSYY